MGGGKEGGLRYVPGRVDTGLRPVSTSQNDNSITGILFSQQ